MNLKGKATIVTGGAAGIGYAIAERFASEGASVMIADVDEPRGQKAARTLAEKGEVHFHKTHVANHAEVESLVAASIEAFGRIDVLVNNAGIVHAADFLDLTEADFDRVLAVNLKGSFLVGQAVARHMVERVKAGEKPGSIVNMSSVNAVFAIANQVPYSISKGGVAQLTRVMALALAPHGIRVNAIGPRATTPDAGACLTSEPDIAALALYLASKRSRTLTGHIFDAAGVAARRC